MGRRKSRLGCLFWFCVIPTALFIFVLSVGSRLDTPATRGSPSTQPVTVDPAVAKAAARQEQIDDQFSPWNGSHYGVVRLVKAAMNDPGSFQHVETRYWDQGDHLIVNMTFRGKNAFGAVVVSTVKAWASIDGDTVELLETY